MVQRKINPLSSRACNQLNHWLQQPRHSLGVFPYFQASPRSQEEREDEVELIKYPVESHVKYSTCSDVNAVQKDKMICVTHFTCTRSTNLCGSNSRKTVDFFCKQCKIPFFNAKISKVEGKLQLHCFDQRNINFFRLS